MLQSILTWIRNLDIRKVAAAIVVLGTLEHGVVVGDISLAHAVPGSWIDPITAWCKIFVYINPFLLAGHSFTALKWPDQASVAVKAIALFAVLAMTRLVACLALIMLVALLALSPASAQTVPLPTPAPIVTKASSTLPQCTLTACTGVYVGGNILNTGMNLQSTSSGLTGLGANGFAGGLDAGYQYWNGSLFAAAEFDAEYGISNNTPNIGVGNSAQWALGGQVKLGYALAGLFGAGAQGQAAPALPAQLANSLISPYIAVGVWDRPWGAGLATGAGVQALIAQNWTLDAEYLHINYNNAAINPNLNEQTENLFMLSLNRHF